MSDRNREHERIHATSLLSPKTVYMLLGLLIAVLVLIIVILVLNMLPGGEPAKEPSFSRIASLTEPRSTQRIAISAPSEPKLPDLYASFDKEEDKKDQIKLEGEQYLAKSWGIESLTLPAGTRLSGEQEPNLLVLPDQEGTLFWTHVPYVGDTPIYELKDLKPVLGIVPLLDGAKEEDRVKPDEETELNLGANEFLRLTRRLIDGRVQELYAVQAHSGGAYLFLASAPTEKAGTKLQKDVETALATLKIGERSRGARAYLDKEIGLRFFLAEGWKKAKDGEKPLSGEPETPGVPSQTGDEKKHKLLLVNDSQPCDLTITQENGNKTNFEAYKLWSEFLKTNPSANTEGELLGLENVRGYDMYGISLTFHTSLIQGPAKLQMIAFNEGEHAYLASLFSFKPAWEEADRQLKLYRATVQAVPESKN